MSRKLKGVKRNKWGQALCRHDKRRDLCRECGGSGLCEHKRVRSQCRECGGASICEHSRERTRCKECGGASICDHNRQKLQCRICNPLKWARGLLMYMSRNAEKSGYCCALLCTPEEVVTMSKKQECVACQGLLDWESRDQKSTPHLHHNHETGIVRGFVHPFCNAIEGQIRLAAGRLNIGKFLKTMFPEVFSQA